MLLQYMIASFFLIFILYSSTTLELEVMMMKSRGQLAVAIRK